MWMLLTDRNSLNVLIDMDKVTYVQEKIEDKSILVYSDGSELEVKESFIAITSKLVKS